MTGSTGESRADFGAQVAALGAWRRAVADALRRYGTWLDEADLSDAGLAARRDRLLRRLDDDRMTIAFVAEFSRGKSELINALFFSGYGRRILPSSAGRTTMCPTELLHDPSRPPSIRLLPIETRLRDVPLADLRASPDDWRETPIDPEDADSVAAAFDAVRQTRKVTVDEAVLMGLHDPQDTDSPIEPDADGMVDIPRWRHAIVNIPDPLLDQGLVVIDTPGLNAIGSEPELTLNLIPSSDAVLFVLAADAGVTRSDIEVWREHIASSHQAGRMVVLNKIDGLWDDLRRPSEIDLEIARQVHSVSQTLSLPLERIHPVSAQKALVARVHGDESLLRRSRITQLEAALSSELVHGRQRIVAEQVGRGVDEMVAVTGALLQSRRRHYVEQLFELNGLRGKNRGAVDLMAQRIKGERTDFEKSLRRLQALRAVFNRHAEAVQGAVAIDSLKRHVRAAREVMKASKLSLGLREGMDSLAADVRGDFANLEKAVGEVTTLMFAMYRSFSAEHGLTLGSPIPFGTQRYLDELEKIDAIYRRQFGALSLVTTEKYALMKRYFESVAARLKALYETAGREVDTWLRALLSPIEGQVREHQQQLRRRLDAVKRVMEASDGLESRIAELESARAQVEQTLSTHDELISQVRAVLGSHREPAAQALQPRAPGSGWSEAPASGEAAMRTAAAASAAPASAAPASGLAAQAPVATAPQAPVAAAPAAVPAAAGGSGSAPVSASQSASLAAPVATPVTSSPPPPVASFASSSAAVLNVPLPAALMGDDGPRADAPSAAAASGARDGSADEPSDADLDALLDATARRAGTALHDAALDPIAADAARSARALLDDDVATPAGGADARTLDPIAAQARAASISLSDDL